MRLIPFRGSICYTLLSSAAQSVEATEWQEWVVFDRRQSPQV